MPEYLNPFDIIGWRGVFGPDHMLAFAHMKDAKAGEGEVWKFKVKTSDVAHALMNDPADYKWKIRKAIKYHWLDLVFED